MVYFICFIPNILPGALSFCEFCIKRPDFITSISDDRIEQTTSDESFVRLHKECDNSDFS